MQDAGEAVGDCVDCNACVAVCPQGIDIRDGQQLECITCALCIDACNGVMDKVGKPRGLISYATLRDYSSNVAGTTAHTTWRSFIRPRSVIYVGVWAIVGLAMLAALLTRDRLDVNVLHDRNPVFVQLADGTVRNGYTVKILNMLPEPRYFRIAVEGLEGATMTMAGSDLEDSTTFDLPVDPDTLRQMKIYVRADPSNLADARTSFRFVVSDLGGSETSTYEANFEIPRKGK
jgi:cytochrome c oxidase accessory protein FixG